MTTSEYTPPPPTSPPPPPLVPPQPTPEEELEAGRTGRLGRRGPRSLTSKLTAFVVSLVVVLVVIISTATWISLRSFLSDRLDQQLQSTVNRDVTPIFQGDASERPTALTIYAVALDPSSGDVAQYPADDGSDGVEAADLSATDRALLIQREPRDGPTTVETTDGHELRVIVLDGRLVINNIPVRNFKIVVGLSTDDEHQTLRQLVLLEVIIGGSAVILALFATAAGVRFSLRRLRRVTATAQEVATELSPEGAGLDRRVPDDEPDTEVGHLATSFNTMLAAVETQFAARVESEERMRQFMADASHELRTPLTSIRGYAELARMQRAVGDNNDDNLDRIEFEGTRMSRLVEDLLMLARGDADSTDRPAQFELIDVSVLLDDAVSGARAAFPARDIRITGTDDSQVVGDPDQLLRVVRNLVTNAAVHTSPERPIDVRSARSGDGVTIQVIDGGPGLPAEDAAHVFERFWRADKARTRARGGSGLGLSIVASIVRAHGGGVRFDSTVEHGSTVSVWLPGVETG